MNPPTTRIGALRAPRGLREARKRNADEHRAIMVRMTTARSYWEAQRAIDRARVEAAVVRQELAEISPLGFWRLLRSRLWR